MSGSLDRILPPRPPIFDGFTGEVLDPDDLGALRSRLKEIEEFLDGIYKKHRQVYEARNRIKARIGELSPTDLPARRNMTKQQQQIERCPRCRTRLPVSHIEEDA